MALVLSVLLGIAVAAALVLGIRLWFSAVQKRRHEKRIGIEILNSRRWNESLDLLVRALGAEGAEPAPAETAGTGPPRAERHLQWGGSRVLLVYKHGTTYRIAAPAMLDAERRRQEAGADAVVIATLGSIDPDALAQAARMKVRCLDGAEVWTKVRRLLDGAVLEGVSAEAEHLIERPRRAASVVAGILGLGIVFWGSRLDRLAAELISPPAPPPAPASSPMPTRTPVPPAIATTPGPAASAAPGDPPEGSPRDIRGELARAIAALPGIGRATWSSGSTLVISLLPNVTVDRGFATTCALSADFPELREVRLQIETSGGDVRWRRCA